MRIFLPVLIFLAAACAEQKTAEDLAVTAAPAATPRLEPLWVATDFSAPEGVAAAPSGGYFISNVVGDATDKDGEGWISVLSDKGEIVESQFAAGLDAPKGMAVLNGILYVADIDQVRLFDAATGEARGEIAVDGAAFLNDATVWQDTIYVSDSRMDRISRLDGDAATTWLEGEALDGVNGLLGAGESLLVSTMTTGTLYKADSDKTLTVIAEGMIDADGIGIVEGGGWLVSAWRGDIYAVSPDGKVTRLLDSREDEILQNDLSVFGDIVIVPNWLPGTVTAWRIVE